MHKASKGFTLLELVVVIIIMSIVMIVATARLAPQLESSKIKSCFSLVKTMAQMARFRSVETMQVHVLKISKKDMSIVLYNKENKKPIAKQYFPNGVSITQMMQKGKVVEKNVLNINFYPNGTAAESKIKFSSGKNSQIIVSIIASNGSVVSNLPLSK